MNNLHLFYPKITSIIMPTYNEAGNIEELILRTEKALKKDFEIIVVDDDSPDGTSLIVKKLQKKKKYLRLVIRKNERGLPSAIKRGLSISKGNVVGWFDSDLGMPPEKLPEMIRALQLSDIAVGSYFIKGGKDMRNIGHAEFFSRLINKMATLILGGGITDYTSGFIVARKEALETKAFYGVHGTYFIRLIYLAKKSGYKIAEIPYTLSPRGHGKSKISGFWPYFKTGLAYIATLIQVRFGL